YALALALALRGAPGIAAVAGDTDGTDGGAGSPDDPAGAFIDQTTLARAGKFGLDPAAFLADNDSTGFFERLGDLLQPGPTFTNVNCFGAVLVDGPSSCLAMPGSAPPKSFMRHPSESANRFFLPLRRWWGQAPLLLVAVTAAAWIAAAAPAAA